jgi:RNA polymerase sigma-70 factor (ECF subfamily)
MENKKMIIEEILKSRHKLFLFSLKLLKNNVQSAEDLTQDALQKAISNVDNLKNTDNIGGWLYTIARNIFINNYRKNKKKLTYYVGDSFESGVIVSIIDSYDSVQNSESNVDFILAQLKRVSPKYRECIELHMGGNKINEIAAMLNIPSGTVKSRIFMGRKELKGKIKPALENLDFEIRD